MAHAGPGLVSGVPWPLAGSQAFCGMDAATRRRLASQLMAALQQDVLETWFMHSVDRERGGFLPDLDRRWRPEGRQDRLLEFQARQTISAARLAVEFSSEHRWLELALHGFRALRDTLWDAQYGGWYQLVDAEGRPLARGTKHAHGTAYAIRACLAIHRASGDPQALKLAWEGVAWLERSLHDSVHGGYHGWACRDGRPILKPEDALDGQVDSDTLGHGIGHKDINVTSDLLETFAELHAAAPSSLTGQRLEELRGCITRMLTPDGALHYVAHADWKPVPGPERFGYVLQTAFRLASAGSLCGWPRDATFETVRRMVSHATECGWHRGGGFMTGGAASPPYSLEGHSLQVSTRSWWVQLEGLRSLILLAVQNHPTRAFFADRLEAHLRFIDSQMRDHRFGGWYATAPADLPWPERLIPSRRRVCLAKGNIWKDSSHEVDAYLNGIRMLLGLDSEAPLPRFG